jgi:hypothetical protein
MAGLDVAIRVSFFALQDVDARDGRGHAGRELKN